MKGIILCGGNGTRLRPLTNITNKHLLAVYNKPMVEYPMRTLIGIGITDILIVSGREHAGSFINYLGSGKDFGVNLTYRVQEKAGGIAEALGLAKGFANGESITVILGDNYFSHPISVDRVAEDSAAIIVKEVEDPERFGVYNQKLEIIEEKPKKPASNLAVTGFYIYPNDVFDLITTLKPSDRGELEITDVNNYYLEQKRMIVAQYNGLWSDMGTPESLAQTISLIRIKTKVEEKQMQKLHRA